MVKLSRLKREDVPRMMAWGKHTDPRFFHYNFDVTTEQGFDFWYRSKKKMFVKRIYKIENFQGIMVGFITIKNIQWFNKSAEMGIVFDPNHLSQGYGTKSIYKIFEEFFEVMGMERLHLKVADFNERAKRVYEKCGFILEKTSVEAFEFQQINKILINSFDDFDDFDGVLYTTYHHMVMTKEKYLKNRSLYKINE